METPKPDKRGNLAKAIYDLGKVAFAALVIGQIISVKAFMSSVFIGGLGFTFISFFIAYSIDE